MEELPEAKLIFDEDPICSHILYNIRTKGAALNKE